MVTKVCPVCWFEFEARRYNAKFCSPACKQKNHRVKHGQVTQNKTTDRRVNDRCTCQHCGKGFWRSGKGRPAKFCGNSCRQMANTAKKAAAFHWYKQQRKISDYEAWCYVESVGTDAMDRLAAAEGWHYSHIERRYYKPQMMFSLDPSNFGFVKNA